TLLSTKLFALFLHSILLSMSDFQITYISVISIRCFHNFFDTTLLLIKISDISGKFYISPYYFSRIFKDATNFTFVKYLNSLRVKESQKLLLNTNMKIKTMCKKVGFGSVSQYNRVFKK
ncbi:MAG: helix-turn-helix transcriptional regulator, partial [Clostridiaceae bacterium]|nr:helix-turn-helix transcriptional regulator [Clostridiaceae bacterium]